MALLLLQFGEFMSKRTIEKKASRTAAYTCLSRACANREKDARFRGPDNMAEVFLPFFAKQIILNVLCVRKFFMKKMAPPGIFEYVLVRTKRIDEVFCKALGENFTQVVLLGAGFDTRPMRFSKKNGGTKIYELDAPTTQQAKIALLKKKGITLPEELVFVPIDFNKEKISEVLSKAGFEEKGKALFVWEGVTMYLTADAVDSTFDFIRKSSSEGSMVVFDYVYRSVLRGENKYYGEREIVKTVSRAGERWTFGIEEGEIEDFLSKRGLRLVSHDTAPDLEKRYLTPDDGICVVRVNGTHCIVTATLSEENTQKMEHVGIC